MALFGLDRLDDARTALRAMSASAEESERVLGELYLSRLQIYEGEFSSAIASLESAVRADRFAGRAYPERARRYLLGRLALLSGDKGEALRQADAILQGADLRVEHLHHAGYLQVLAGDVRAAEDTLKRLQLLLAAHPNAFGRSSALHLEGEIAGRRNRIATELLHEADAAFPIYYAHVRLAELAEARKDWSAAIAEWSQVIGSRGDILRDGFPADLPNAELRRARANARVGNIPDAKAGYEHVLGIWQRGDDMPIRREAAIEVRQLSNGGNHERPYQAE
jgi:tetratricopeptide (TPR) repeat protein